MYYITDFPFVKKNIDYLFYLRYNIFVTFDKAVLGSDDDPVLRNGNP